MLVRGDEKSALDHDLPNFPFLFIADLLLREALL